MLDEVKEPWPANYLGELNERRRRLLELRDPSGGAIMRWGGKLPAERWDSAKALYRKSPHLFMRHWGITYDPRVASTENPALLPFIPFKRQRELTSFVYSCLQNKEAGLIEKSRDMGATWTCGIISAHLWLFVPGVSVGWGSRKAQLVDRLGDLDSIFEKIRMQLRNVPQELMPEGFRWSEHDNLMRIINPETGATITGEGGDDIGRGGRKSIYFVDEAAHLEHPESIEASLNSNTDVRIDISSVGAPGNVFHRRREAGAEWDPKAGIVKGKTQIFVMDWRQHPGKTQAWYDTKRQKAEDEGLLHLHAQEIDRDYSASIQGTVIPAAWARSAIDAHVRLGFIEDGGWLGGLDVADEGADRNALCMRRGVIIRDIQEWGVRDTGVTARRAVAAAEGLGRVHMQYDAVGVGSGVKAEYNRLLEDRVISSKGVRFVGWNGGGSVLYPERRVVRHDQESPLNKDFFANLKAQGWWSLRRRFELTHKAVRLVEAGRTVKPDESDIRELAKFGAEKEGVELYNWDEADLISIPSDLALTWKLVKELSQPVAIKNSKMKLLIDKTPEGTMSPNLADAVMMCFFPVRASAFDIPEKALEKAQAPQPKSLAPRDKRQPFTPGKLPPAPVQFQSEVEVAPGMPPVRERHDQPIARERNTLRSTRPPLAGVTRID